jgi:hypothetical protein
MRFIYKGDVYAINFQRKKVLVKAYSEGADGKETLSKYPSTEVVLLKLDPKEFGTKNSEIVAVGSVGCYVKDKFDPEIGRRMALTDMCTTPRNREARNGQPARVPKDMARLVWKAYFNRNNPDVEVSDEGGNEGGAGPVGVLPVKDAELINEAYVVG